MSCDLFDEEVEEVFKDDEVNKKDEKMPDLIFQTYDNIKTAAKYDQIEYGVIDGILNRRIQMLFEKYEWSLERVKTIFEGNYCSTNEKCHLNYIIRIISSVENVPVVSIALWIDQFCPIQRAMLYFDESTMSLLRTEASAQYNIEMEDEYSIDGDFK